MTVFQVQLEQFHLYASFSGDAPLAKRNAYQHETGYMI